MDFNLFGELKYNPEILGRELEQNAGRFHYVSFSEFLKNQREKPTRPRQPNRPYTTSENPIKVRVFEQVYRTALQQYNQKIKDYEKQKKQHELITQYEKSYSGYAHYLTENNPATAPFLSRRHKIPVREKQRQLHTYITGGTGSGKSEVIKSFIWHYLVRNKSTGIVLLTPHGKVAKEVANFWVNIENDRLVYLSPDLDPKYCPCINPFDIEGKSKLSDREAENYAEEFRAVFQELLQDVFTEQMNALLKNILPVLIKYPSSSIHDLLDFLSTTDTKASKYIEYANKHFSNRSMLEFLNGQFVMDKSYKRTKSAMQTRLHSMFSTTLMQNFMLGRSTINLEKLINERKMIVFDISKGNCPQEWDIIGKLIIAQVKIIAFRREKIPENERVPCHLFIDEFQNYITPSIQEILEESRKYKLYLTMAQQTAGAKMSKDLFRSILGNTGIKITGRNGDIETLNTLARSTGADVEQLKTELATGRFSVWRTALTGEAQRPPVVVSMPTNTLDNSAGMNETQWVMLTKGLLSHYYKRTDTKTQKQDKSPTEAKNTPLKEHNFNLDDYLN